MSRTEKGASVRACLNIARDSSGQGWAAGRRRTTEDHARGMRHGDRTSVSGEVSSRANADLQLLAGAVIDQMIGAIAGSADARDRGALIATFSDAQI